MDEHKAALLAPHCGPTSEEGLMAAGLIDEASFEWPYRVVIVLVDSSLLMVKLLGLFGRVAVMLGPSVPSGTRAFFWQSMCVIRGSCMDS